MHLNNKRILVTGATGFIGSHVTRACVREGAAVACAIREKSNPWRLLEALPSIKRYDVDLTDEKAVGRMFDDFRPQIVLNLAAHIDRTRDLNLYDEQHESNTTSTLNLVRAALRSDDLIRFVHTGTIEEYGRRAVPFSESQREEPITPYSLTKHESTRIVLYAAHEQGLPAIILRPCVVYGPLQGKKMFIPMFIRAALTTKSLDTSPGDQTRDFLHVYDAVSAYITAATCEGQNGEIFNVAAGVEIKLKDVAEKLRTIFNGDIEINYGARSFDPNVETMRCFMDISKIRERLNWTPTITLEEGLKQTAEWYRNNASVYEHLWD